MGALRMVHHNVHRVQVDGQQLLFHVPTTSIFELDEIANKVLGLFRERPEVSEADIRVRFEERFTPEEIDGAVQDLLDLDVLQGDRALRPEHRPVNIRNFPLSTIVLNVNTGCNLSCTYCYKEDLQAPSKGQRMEFATAAKSIELLLEQADQRDRINVVFFGGEPLSNMPLIRRTVDYAERRCAEVGKGVDFSLTTNGTLLSEKLVDYFDAHRFGITVSMDGPRALHDRNRRTVGGRGTYDVVAAKARMLLERYESRPVGARVTLTTGVTEVERIFEHLKNELGFAEVGLAPVTSGDKSDFNLKADELLEVFEGMKRLGRRYLDAALVGANTGFSNLHQLMTDLSQGTRKALPCGAGLGLMAVDKDGELNLCHRFTGSDLPTFGNVEVGIDKQRLGTFLERAADRTGTDCSTCRIRNLCAGGCYHERYARYNDPLHPSYHYCDLMRDWVDFGIETYSRILKANPGFFASHIETRKGTPQ